MSLVVAAVVACERGSGRGERADTDLEQRLVGTWTVRFELERPPLPRGEGPAVRVVEGQFALLANRSVNESYPPLARPTNYGTFNVDFAPFGFKPGDSRRTPTLVAGWLSQDSVEIILAPDESQTVVMMRGQRAADTIAGTWSVSIARVGGGGGRFVMSRR
jgi:hypothetical protein